MCLLIPQRGLIQSFTEFSQIISFHVNTFGFGISRFNILYIKRLMLFLLSLLSFKNGSVEKKNAWAQAEFPFLSDPSLYSYILLAYM